MKYGIKQTTTLDMSSLATYTKTTKGYERFLSREYSYNDINKAFRIVERNWPPQDQGRTIYSVEILPQ